MFKIVIEETESITDDQVLSVATSAVAYCLGHINETMPSSNCSEYYADRLLKALEILTNREFVNEYKDL